VCGGHSIVCYELYIAYLHTCLTHVTSSCLICPCTFILASPVLCKNVIAYILKRGELCTDCI